MDFWVFFVETKHVQSHNSTHENASYVTPIGITLRLYQYTTVYPSIFYRGWGLGVRNISAFSWKQASERSGQGARQLQGNHRQTNIHTFGQFQSALSLDRERKLENKERNYADTRKTCKQRTHKEYKIP